MKKKSIFLSKEESIQEQEMSGKHKSVGLTFGLSSSAIVRE